MGEHDMSIVRDVIKMMERIGMGFTIEDVYGRQLPIDTSAAIECVRDRDAGLAKAYGIAAGDYARFVAWFEAGQVCTGTRKDGNRCRNVVIDPEPHEFVFGRDDRCQAHGAYDQ